MSQKSNARYPLQITISALFITLSLVLGALLAHFDADHPDGRAQGPAATAGEADPAGQTGRHGGLLLAGAHHPGHGRAFRPLRAAAAAHRAALR